MDPSRARPPGHFVSIDDVPLPTFVWRADGDALALVAFNRAAAGADPALAAPGLIDVDALERDNAGFLGLVRRALADGATVTAEHDYVSAGDGARRPTVATLVPVDDNTVVVYGLDVSDRARGESDLRRAENRFRTAFESSPLGTAIICVDDTGCARIVESNPTFRAMFGEGARLDLSELAGLVAGGHAVRHVERTLTSVHGTRMNLSIWVSPLPEHPETGERLALCHFQDDTERRASEARYRQIVETTSEGIWLLDAQMRTTFVNERMAEMLGYSTDEMLGTTPADHTVDGRMPDIDEQERQARAAGSRQYEDELRRRDGSTLWVSISHDWLLDPDGVRTGALAMMSDITTRKRAEMEVREARSRFIGAFANAPTGMALIGVNDDDFGVLLEVNPALCRLLGREEPEVVGRHITAFTHPDDVERNVAAARRLTEGEIDRYETDKRMVSADGEELLTNVSGSVVHDESGRRLYGVLHVQDVTARRRAEEAVEERERRFRTAFAVAGDPIVILDDERRMVMGNRALGELLGIDTDDIPGRRIDEFSAVDPDAGERIWERLLADGELTGEYELFGADGEPRTVEFSARANFTPGQHLSIMRDVTERRRAEAAREAARRENDRLESALNQAQKLETVGQLAGGVAHDFNNILAVILNSSEFAIAELAGHPALEDVRAVHEAAERAAALTRQLLVLSRREIAEPRVVALNELVADVERLVRRTISEQIDVRLALGEDTPPVRADPSHIEQVVLNLVVNARDAMPEGGTLCLRTQAIELDEEYVRLRPGLSPGRHAMLSVSDTGEGMRQEVLQRAFDPFFTTKPKGSGTGLGLATTYGIVKQNGGHIELYSEVGNGTVAKVLLPAAGTTREEPAAELVQENTWPGHGERILVVEDESGVRAIAARILGGAGYDVLTASHPEEALEIASRSEIDLVVTDIVMPGMSGPQLVDRLRELRSDLPAIFMSGYTDRPGALPADARFVSKPFSRRSLLEQIADGLQPTPEQP